MGGDWLNYPSPISTETAEVHTAIMRINYVVPTKGARFVCLDIRNVYIGTTMNRYEYMWIKVKFYLCVDDFGVKYENKSNVLYFLAFSVRMDSPNLWPMPRTRFRP